MLTHTIVELEEGALTATVAAREGGTTKVLRSVRVPLPDLGRDGLTKALRGLGADVLQGVTGAHVVLGERRIHHFLSTVPKMPAREVIGFVMREALRVTGMPSNEDVLVAPRLLRRLPGNRLVIGSTALARNVWEPVREAFAQAGVEVLGLHSMETTLAMAAPPEVGQSHAVLETNAGRARFVLCDGRFPVQVRRFLIGAGSDGNSSALAAQLAMELPRTLDWLRETGHGQPTVLLLGARVGIDDESIEMIRGDLQQIVRAKGALAVADEQALPGLGVAKLFEGLFEGAVPPSLLAPPEIRLPWSAGRVASLVAAAAAGLACSWSGVVDGTAFLGSRTELQAAAAATQQLQQELQELQELQRAASAQGGESVDETRLLAALHLRRPISRLCSEVSNCADTSLHLDELKFSSTERIVVTGVVHGESRKGALATLASFSKRLRELPYVQSDGQEEVAEVAGQQSRFRFRLSLSWRNS